VLKGVACGNNTFVAIGEGNTINTSPDGVSWAAVSYRNFGTLQNVAYENNFFLAVGVSGTILQSDALIDDVPPGSWALGYINDLYQHRITYGCGDGNYCPNEPATRGQIAAVMTRAIHGEDFSYNLNPYFSDVPVTNPFFKYVQKIREEAITVASDTYGINDATTRGQMAAFLIRAKYGENFSYTTTPYFRDVLPTNNFFKYVQRLKDDGLTAVSDIYGVDDLVTRDQMAAFISRAFLGMR
jgi:hypothetical protein